MSRSSAISTKGKTPLEIIAALSASGWIDDGDRHDLERRAADCSDELIRSSENVIGEHRSASALAMHFRVNAEDYLIPMVTEEATVVAAASKAAKMTRPDGFAVKTYPRLVKGHFCLVGPRGGAATVRRALDAERSSIMEALRRACDPMAARGGGLRDIAFVELAKPDDSLEITVVVDTVDAMGAKLAMRMADAAAKIIQERVGGEPVGAIVCNDAPGIGAYVKATWPRSAFSERHLARFLYMNAWAEASPGRAVTHDKGIMNGVEAVCRATGQDTRAIYASIYAHAYRRGHRHPLSHFKLSENGDVRGRLYLPLHVATAGGATMSSGVRSAFRLMGIDTLKPGSSKTLAEIVVAVGLAQNFAALYQLSSLEGFGATYERR
jgi:hydroxymethylglutaryl-CoA reductase